MSLVRKLANRGSDESSRHLKLNLFHFYIERGDLRFISREELLGSSADYQQVSGSRELLPTINERK